MSSYSCVHRLILPTYASSYFYMCVLTLLKRGSIAIYCICVFILLCTPPLSSYCYTHRLILPTCVLILLKRGSIANYSCVHPLILLHMCPHTTNEREYRHLLHMCPQTVIYTSYSCMCPPHTTKGRRDAAGAAEGEGARVGGPPRWERTAKAV